MRTITNIIAEVLVRAGTSTTSATDGLYSDLNLATWIDQAHKWAAAYRKWPFTEGRNSTTYVSATEEYTYPEGFRSDSIRYLTVGGKRLTKTAFQDYQTYREDNASGADKIYSDYGRLYFINPNAGVSGTTTVYGQYVPAAIDTTDNTATTVFSDNDEEGNEAIVEEMLRYAKERERNQDEALVHHTRALEALEGLYRRYKDEQSAYLSKNREMFKRMDIVRGGVSDELIKRDQF